MVKAIKIITQAPVFALFIVLNTPPALAANSGCTRDLPSRGDCTGVYKDSGQGNASNGDVTIDENVTKDVLGGYSVSGDATDNKVTINGGTVGRNVFGGNVGAIASDNSVTINGGTVGGDVYGGWSNSGVANGNSVTINGGMVGGDVFGGYSFSGDATDNKVTINGGTVGGDVYGGNAGAIATGNSITINGGTVGGDVFGGYSESGDATDNKVTISGGTVGGNVFGGYSESGDATNNSVTINGGTVTKNVYGGNAKTIASGNKVTINGGTVGGNVYGGYSSNTSTTTGNSITISGTPTFGTETILSGGNGADATGNVLTLHTAITVKGAEKFQFYNLYGMSDQRSTLTNINPVDLNSTTVTLQRISGTKVLSVGDTITLISKVSGNGNYTTTTGIEQSAALTQRQYSLSLNVDNSALTATVTQSAFAVKPETSSLSDATVAAQGMMNTAADFAAGDGMREARSIAGLDSGLNAGDGDSLRGGAFAAMTGGQLRYRSNGRTTVNGVSLLGGLSVGVPLPAGQAMAGVFVESGWGNYNGRSNTDINSEGNTRYYGGGVLGRYELDGFYVEGSGRIGRAETDYASDLTDGIRKAYYKRDNTYYGLHGGLGYVLPLSNSINVDLSSKYFWTHQSGNNISILDEDVSIAAANSHRWRTGARINLAATTGVAPYIGGYYEHEFDAKAKMTTLGLDIPGPSLKGSTGVAELGVTFGAPTDGYRVDIGVTGYAGKYSGATGSIKARWAF